jgi:acyl dehydratase
VRTCETIADLAACVGQTLGTSEWRAIDQSDIDAFASATGDRQWIHVDVERASGEMPGGRTIAHGYLLLSLLPQLSATIFTVQRRSRGINYGLDKVRFVTPVPAGSRVRLTIVLDAAVPVSGGMRFTCTSTMALEGAARPALVAATLAQLYD